jgi:hypothetical protein
MVVVEAAATTQRVASPDGAAAHESRRRAPVLQEKATTRCGVGCAGCRLVARRGKSLRRRARCRDRSGCGRRSSPWSGPRGQPLRVGVTRPE